jgi:predicted phosphoadenosine phosphosulfate sulfurtransferase
MAIVRYENLTINRVTNGINSVGEYTTTIAKWFETRGLVHDVVNSVRISERYRTYTDLVSITLQYTPNSKEIVDNQNLYSITWRGFDWRITDVRETNDRMKVTFLCYRNDPETPV